MDPREFLSPALSISAYIIYRVVELLVTLLTLRSVVSRGHLKSHGLRRFVFDFKKRHKIFWICAGSVRTQTISTTKLCGGRIMLGTL